MPPSPSISMNDLPPMDIIFGASEQMRTIKATIEKVALSDIPVLIEGESGTGKEIVAKLLHGLSDRAAAPWVKVICPAIPGSLIESELFGYEKGAFTGATARKSGRVEIANRGTLFLDEIGSLDVSVQAKLLQLLQDGSFTRVGGHESIRIDARIISAANGNLQRQLQEGSIRLDFLARINAVTITLPPLRQRKDDLPAMVDYFAERYSQQFRTRPKRLSNGIRTMMTNFDWPGNIRQLENMVRNFVLMDSEEALASELMRATVADSTPEVDLAKPLSLKELTKAAKRDLERRVILKVLQANGWSRQKTAKWLNISYRSLLYKLEGSPVVRRSRKRRQRENDSNSEEAVERQ